MRAFLFYSCFILCVFGPVLTQAQERYDYDPFTENIQKDFIPELQLKHLQSRRLSPSENLILNQNNLSITETPKSTIEAYYSDRIIDEVAQFGYDLFIEENIQNTDFTPRGAVQNDFILNVDDGVTVILRGQINSQKTYFIARNGLLTLDDLSPVPAAGRTITQVQNALKSQLAEMPNVDLYLSLDKVRQISVLIIGHVKKPGRKNLTVFNTLLDALSMAGGIEKNGSLRSIKLVRSGRTKIIDLYSLLIHNSDMDDVRLQDGDRIIIPPLGPTIAISGAVKRPGIYEIRKTMAGMHFTPSETSEKLNLEQALTLAGGLVAPGQNRFMHLELGKKNSEDVQEIYKPFQSVIKDGSVILVSQSNEIRREAIELTGHTRKEGLHALNKNKTLSDLLTSDALGESIYPLIGVIERYDPHNLKRDYLTFPLNLVLKDQYDQRLMDGDVVHLFSDTQIYNLQKKHASDLLVPATFQEQGSAMQDLRQENYITSPILADILREHAVHMKGAVRLPGAYPISQGGTLEDILSVSGGLTLEANRGRIEVTSNQLGIDGQSYGRSGTQRALINLSRVNASSIPLTAGDTVRVNQTVRKLKNDTVLLRGEVVQPGAYNLMPGDRLSTLIARAGGLTPEAYPDGAIFSRDAMRRAEEQRYRATGRDMERALAAALSKNKNGPSDSEIAMTRALISELKDVKAVGRMTVEASPDKLLSYPELDVLLEPGDRIHVPKRPYSVRVRGEVLSPANLQFRSGKSPRDYLMEAGGYTHYADKGRTFVIYPDGSAQPLQVSNWNYKPVMIPPGSTIIVPRDPKPFDFMETAKDVSQILGNLAVSAVIIDDIQDD